MEKADIVVVGAGIVGLATALQILNKKPSLRVVILEKENAVAKHQTSHNSGVIHSGIYYKPNSLKAQNCLRGYQYLLDFCQKHDIRHEICGKVIVATADRERLNLEAVFQKGVANGLTGIRKITASEVREIEPHVAAVEGIWVPQTGIVDFPAMAQKMADLLGEQGATICLNEKLLKIEQRGDEQIVVSSTLEISTKLVVTCAGLYADHVAQLSQPEIDLKILPFRGEYFELKKERESLVKNLVYPVPDPNFPFLGVHFTRMIHGGIEAGPNAVFAFRREGYRLTDFDAKEFFEVLAYPGFQKIAWKYWQVELFELWRSFSKAAFVRTLQKLIPEITAADLVEGGSGVRAQACDRAGNLVDDFAIFENARVVNVCNAPSPAATASLAIGETVAERVLAKL